MAQKHSMIFINLPVADVTRSREFFTKVGYAIDERMSNEDCLGIELGPNIYAMLLKRDFFATFHNSTVAEPGQHEVLVCVSADSIDHVDTVVDAATSAGGQAVRTEGADTGYMYGRSYADLDGHIWEVMWMDVEKATEAGAFG